MRLVLNASFFIMTSFVLSIPLRCEIPFTEGKAVYENTLPRFKKLSPFWGMVGLYSDVVKNACLYLGPYTPIPHPNLSIHPSFKKPGAYSHPQSAIAAVLQYLFPSPDGVNFVANERGKDPIGLIANEVKDKKEKPGKRTGLQKIEALLIEIQNYRQVLQGAAAAADSSEETRKGQDAAFQKHVWEILANANAPAPQAAGQALSAFDYIRSNFAKLLQQAVLEEVADRGVYYPPNFVEVALLTYAWMIADAAEDLYRGMPNLFGGQGKTREKRVQELMAKHDLTPLTANTYDAALRDFLAKYKSIANKAAAEGEEHKDKDLLAPSAASEPHHWQEGDESYDIDLAMMLQGHRAYKEILPQLISYTITSYNDPSNGKVSYPDCGETALRNFFNIVWNQEGTISQDHIQSLIDQLKRQHVPHGDLKKIEEIKEFYRHYPYITSSGTESIHAAWSQIVSNLDKRSQGSVNAAANVGAGDGPDVGALGRAANADPLPIIYRFPEHLPQKTCNLQGTGIINMLNLIAHLIPDATLNTPWPSSNQADKENFPLIARKLDRLCDLMSRGGSGLKAGGFILDWNNDKGEKEITNVIIAITFTINGIPAFVWDFEDGHFHLQPAVEEKKDWRTQSQQVPHNGFLKAWLMQFKNPGRVKANDHLPYEHPYELLGHRLYDRDTALKIIDTILSEKWEKYFFSIPFLVKKSIPINDNDALKKLLLPLYGQEWFFTNPAFQDIDEALSQYADTDDWKWVKEVVPKVWTV